MDTHRERHTGKVLPLRRAAGKTNKKRIVAREPLPAFAMLDTCFSMAEQPERGGFTSSYGGTPRNEMRGREGTVRTRSYLLFFKIPELGVYAF